MTSCCRYPAPRCASPGCQDGDGGALVDDAGTSGSAVVASGVPPLAKPGLDMGTDDAVDNGTPLVDARPAESSTPDGSPTGTTGEGEASEAIAAERQYWQ